MALPTVVAVRYRFSLFAVLLLCSAVSSAQIPEPAWTPEQLNQLQAWLKSAPLEGLAVPPTSDAVPTSATATSTALGLARTYLFGTATAQQRAGWNIESNDEAIDLPGRLATALARDELDGFFRSLRPRNPQYEALRQALLVETDADKRAILIRNLDRWRWMPLDMGHRYLLVNAPGFEVGLWDNGRIAGRWRVIVGKPSTPTPVFSAVVTGVTINPWWDVPPSIVAESVGRLTRTNPAEARRRGYVWGGGAYRQRPGPGNALGLMKLVMPNPYKVYLHDTPTKALFEQPVRAFSHGCIRVDKALNLAERLLGRPVDADVTRGRTATLPFDDPIPVYITYFTADISEAGTVEYHGDIYGRDARMGDRHNSAPNYETGPSRLGGARPFPSGRVKGKPISNYDDVVLDAADPGRRPGRAFSDLALVPGMHLAAEPDRAAIGCNRDRARIKVGIAPEGSHDPVLDIGRRWHFLDHDPVAHPGHAGNARNEVASRFALEVGIDGPGQRHPAMFNLHTELVLGDQ
jgi:L,D-transpeptidase YcbB